MRRGYPGILESSFLSVEKDADLILKKLFMESQPYSNQLKRLLVANTKDCLDNQTSETLLKVDNMTVKELFDQGYVTLVPKLDLEEHEEVKSYMIISFDNFERNYSNPEFRDSTISFAIICHPDYWDLGGFRLRPLKIIGIIDGILNESNLTGIGRLEFIGCNEVILDGDLCGYTLVYKAIHGSDDSIK